MPQKPKRTTTTRKASDASQPKRKPRQTKRAEPKVEPVAVAPAPTPAPVALPPVSERWTIGTALLVVGIGLLVVLATFGVLKLATGGGDALKLDAGVPTAASASALRSYASDHGPVYWIGPPENGRLEVTRTSRGIYVRYLTGGAALGDKSARYTTIGTYPMRGAFRRMAASARSNRFDSAKIPAGGLAAWSKSAPTSVYLAYPRRAYLVEVYDPSAQRAKALALSGVVKRVG